MTASRPHAAIALFLYKRLEHATRVVDALRRNRAAATSELCVFCDGARHETERADVALVRRFARSIDGFKHVRVVERDSNRGIARSIIDGMSEVFTRHERAIVIEDDVVCSPAALAYFNAMLEHFASWRRVSSISAFAFPRHLVPLPRYPYDVYFTPRLNCWGWATWRDRWQSVTWDPPDADEWLSPRIAAFSRAGSDLPELWRLHRAGQIDSWAIRWSLDQFRRGTVTVHPCESYAMSIGFDGSGTHQITQDESHNPSHLSTLEQWRMPPRITFNRRILWAHRDRADRLLASGRVRRLLSFPAWWVRLARRAEMRRMSAPPIA